MSKILSTTLMVVAFVIAVGLSFFALSMMYWAAGMYFGWKLTVSATAAYLLSQYLVLRAMNRWSES